MQDKWTQASNSFPEQFLFGNVPPHLVVAQEGSCPLACLFTLFPSPGPRVHGATSTGPNSQVSMAWITSVAWDLGLV